MGTTEGLGEPLLLPEEQVVGEADTDKVPLGHCDAVEVLEMEALGDTETEAQAVPLALSD